MIGAWVATLALAVWTPQQEALVATESAWSESSMVAMPSTRRGALNTSDSADYDVFVTYRVRFGSEPLRLIALGLDGVLLQGISVRLDRAPIGALAWERTLAPSRIASADAAGFAEGGTTDPVLWEAALDPAVFGIEGGEHTVEVAYTVEGAYHDGRRLTLPLVVPEATPPEPLPGAFEAEVEMPAAGGEGVHVTTSFPADVTGGAGPSDATVRASLPVIPRVVRLDLGRGEGRPWARISVLETLASLLIVVFGALGWRHLQRAE